MAFIPSPNLTHYADLSFVGVTLDEPIQANDNVIKDGQWMITSDRTERLLREGKAGVAFRAKDVIYADGTRESF